MNYKFKVGDKVYVKESGLIRRIKSCIYDNNGPKYQLTNHFLGWHREEELERLHNESRF